MCCLIPTPGVYLEKVAGRRGVYEVDGVGIWISVVHIIGYFQIGVTH
jgi:hypothetical protein